MKNKIAFFFLLISFVDISFIMAESQNIDSTMQVLKPLDWEIMSCGKSKIGKDERDQNYHNGAEADRLKESDLYHKGHMRKLKNASN